MAAQFTVDGKSYSVHVPAGGLVRNFEVLDGQNAGRLLSGEMKRDIIGTFYNYTLTIETDKLSLAEYDQLYQVLSAPVDSHTVSFPYGQSTLTFQAYVASGEDSLLLAHGGKHYWQGLSVKFVAMSPQRT